MHPRGFTLLETAITTFILTGGLVAAAWVFAVSGRTNVNNHQRTIALLLLREKMEQLKQAAPNNTLWESAGGLDPAAPIEGYFDNPSPPGDALPCLRLWQVSGTTRRSMTVVIYTWRAGLMNRFIELARATTIVSP